MNSLQIISLSLSMSSIFMIAYVSVANYVATKKFDDKINSL